MRKLFVVLSFLMVASMLLSACGPTATTAAPATAAPATAAPATAAPATAAPATAAPATAAPCRTHTLVPANWMAMAFPPISSQTSMSARALPIAFDWDTYHQ